MFGHKNLITSTHPEHKETQKPETSDTVDHTFQPPTLQAHDQPISSLPKEVSYTVDQLRRAFGFRNVSPILPHLKGTFKSNFHISSIGEEPITDIGQHANI